MKTSVKLKIAAGAAAAVCMSGQAGAEELRTGGKLLLTGGVSSLEGAAGGGLATWAVIAGNETRDGVGAAVHATGVLTDKYNLSSYGVAVGFFDRVELSAAHQEFDTGDAGATLGIGQNFKFNQDVYGAKVRVLGDAVYDQDSMLPQISIGVQYKVNDKEAIINAIGGVDNHGTDYFISATKVVLDQSLVLNATVRETKANQTGLLGFGGDQNDDYRTEIEASAGYLVSKRLVIGGEYRSKPDNLGFAEEDDWFDVFGAYAINKTVSITAAYVDLGDIATFKEQRGVYLSLQAGF